MSDSKIANAIDTGIYIHWPFCKSKCPYCDFNVHVHDSIDQGAWKHAYARALGHYAARFPERRIVSVFFGGGTPSLMPVETVGEILKTINDSWILAPDAEVTLEANPTSVEAEKFKGFRAAGINRVSLGVQSLDDGQLKFLGRMHNAKEAVQAIETARKIFDRYSFDLIYARPGQTLQAWESELRGALAHAEGHMSLYQLTIERSTPFYLAHEQGKFTMPAQELAADFYTLTQEVMEGAGLPAYEVSNHAQPGQESRHNRLYWEYGDYIGIGPGAHGRISLLSDKVSNSDFLDDLLDDANRYKVAIRDHQAPGIWLDRVELKGHGAHPEQALTPREKFLEALMMGLRLREGVTLEHLRTKSGINASEALHPKKLKQAVGEGWLVKDAKHLQATREGWLRLNSLVPFILKDDF
ncbi:MAG: coproporphyrinogen III oxidase [Alphaproteobacteria bacterium PRO2]|nr:coproporphyrinogen III oxidase [Alphaproteobacteria bacterium PRO2]